MRSNSTPPFFLRMTQMQNNLVWQPQLFLTIGFYRYNIYSLVPMESLPWSESLWNSLNDHLLSNRKKNEVSYRERAKIIYLSVSPLFFCIRIPLLKGFSRSFILRFYAYKLFSRCLRETFVAASHINRPVSVFLFAPGKSRWFNTWAT